MYPDPELVMNWNKHVYENRLSMTYPADFKKLWAKPQNVLILNLIKEH